MSSTPRRHPHHGPERTATAPEPHVSSTSGIVAESENMVRISVGPARNGARWPRRRSDSRAWPSGLDSGERWGPGRQVIRRCSMILSVEPEPKKVPYPARVARPPVLGPGPVGPTTNGPPDVIRNVPVVKPLRDVVP